MADTISQTLKAVREELGWTAAQLELETTRWGGRVDARYIALIEKKQRACSIEELLAISVATGRSPAWFLIPPTAKADTPIGFTIDSYGKERPAREVWDWLTAKAHPWRTSPPLTSRTSLTFRTTRSYGGHGLRRSMRLRYAPSGRPRTQEVARALQKCG